MLKINSIEWHKENIKYSSLHINRLIRNVNQEIKNINNSKQRLDFYILQIKEAEEKGKISFDADKFLKKEKVKISFNADRFLKKD